MSGIDEGDNMSNESGSPWNNERYLSTYEEALSLKNALQAKDRAGMMQLKIKRCGVGGTMYVVKSRQDPKALEELKKIEEKLSSKKKSKT